MFIKTFQELSKNDTAIAGGKGASLGEMTKAGIPVPPGFVVLATAFDKFLEETDLDVEIEAFLHKVNHKDINSVERVSTQIRGLITKAEFSKDIAQDIVKAFIKLNAKFVAVRSSATAEDSTVASWAGELESYLNTTNANLLENVKRCWSSLFTPRAIFYRFEKKMHTTKVSVAVVVQTMIQSEVAGVCFTVHPVTKDYDQMVIEGGFGLGEAIVGGKITPDTYVIHKKDWEILDKNISQQTIMITRDKNINIEKEVPKLKQGKQKLGDEKIIQLAQLCQKIETHYSHPQDIEWAFEKGKFYIVQSRPITTLPKHPFIRQFQKFFTREIPLIVIEYWHRGEYKELHKILKETTHFNPLFVRNKNSLTDVYYDINNPDTALQPLFDYFKKNPNEFDQLSKEFKFKQKQISDLLNNFKIRSFSELFDNIAEAWGYLPIWVQFGSADKNNVVADSIEKSYRLRDKFQEVEYKTGEVLLSAIKNKYFKLEKYADVISAQEAINNAIPDLIELKNRKDGFVYFEGQIITRISKKDFAVRNQISFVEDLITIGESDLHNKKIGDENTKFIKGKVAYPGLVRGRVRVIMSKDDLNTIQSGEILVTSMTTPEYIPALKKAAAFVTDEGGITSHAAVVARELKKPCIIGTKNATQRLKDGDLVKVDASKGIVKIINFVVL